MAAEVSLKSDGGPKTIDKTKLSGIIIILLLGHVDRFPRYSKKTITRKDDANSNSSHREFMIYI